MAASFTSAPSFRIAPATLWPIFFARSACDNLPAGDVKSISKSAEYLFRCGHVQSIQYASDENYYFFKAKCLSEMRKDRVYLLKMILLRESFDISYAECGCPAGMGSNCSCKHIASLAYALADVCKLQSLPEFESCTSHLQQWNRPRGRHLDPIPVDMLGSRRRELIHSKSRDYGSMIVYDPRPFNERMSDPKALERFRCDLLGLSQPVGFLNIIIPLTDLIVQDHCYASVPSNGVSSVWTGCDVPVSIVVDDEVATIDTGAKLFEEVNVLTPEIIIDKMQLTSEEINELEEMTRDQSHIDRVVHINNVSISINMYSRCNNPMVSTTMNYLKPIHISITRIRMLL